MPRQTAPPAAGNRPPAVRVVTLTEDELRVVVADACAEGYRRASEERERTLTAIAADLDRPHLKPVLTVTEAAEYARRGAGTVRRWIRDGLPAEKRAGTAGYRIRTVDLEAWLHSGRA